MSPRRSKWIDKAVVAALRDIKICEAAIVAYNFAARTMDNRALGYGSEVKPDERMRLQLYRLKSDAQARALMFGNLTLNDDLRKQALRAATDFIMRDHAQIIGYLTVEGVPPSRYLSSVDEEFRQEIRAAVREQLGVDPDEDDQATYGVTDPEQEDEDEDEL